MGSRRLGAKRLNAALKRGSQETDSLYQAGAAATDMIVSHNIRREGKLIITEVAVDLGGKGTTVIACTANANRPIGLKASTDGAQLLQWQDSIHGTFQFAEVLVVEVANGETAMSLRSGDAVEPPDAAINAAGAVLAAIPVNAAGIYTSRDMDAATAETTLLVNDEYLYLTNDTTTAVDFTAGRVLIRLVGVDNTWTF